MKKKISETWLAVVTIIVKLHCFYCMQYTFTTYACDYFLCLQSVFWHTSRNN